MTTNIQTSNPKTEQPDCRPNQGGEYICLNPEGPTKRFQVYHFCFVCEKSLSQQNAFEARAIVQCQDAGQRIVNLFGRGAHLEEQTHADGTAEIVITACLEHEIHLQHLVELASADGIITGERIVWLRHSMISRQKFDQLVQDRAYKLWQDQVSQRSWTNWDDAWRQLIKELGHIPSLSQRDARAKKLHADRKGPQADEDRHEAEQFIAKSFTVSPTPM
jgi:hypothetical protein